MKKVLHVSKYYYSYIDGIEQTAEDIVNSLKSKYDQKVIGFNEGRKTIEDKVNDIDVLRVGCCANISRQAIALSYKKRLKRIFNEYKPDMVIKHNLIKE